MTSHVHTTSDDIWQNQGMEEKKKNLKALFVIWIVVTICVLLVFFVIYHIMQNSTNDKSLFEQFPDEGCYVWLVDCIDQSTSYDIIKKDYAYTNSDENVDMVVRYVQLKYDKQDRDLQYINELLMNCVERCKDYAELFEGMEESELHQYIARCEIFVTHNDEDKLSTIMYCNDKIDGKDVINAFYVYNYDLNAGCVVRCDDLLVYDENFVAHWMELYDEQKGSSASEYKNLSADELLEIFNSYDCIAFYTSEGMEVGYEYYEEDTKEQRLVTVTLKDYEQYLNIE